MRDIQWGECAECGNMADRTSDTIILRSQGEGRPFCSVKCAARGLKNARSTEFVELYCTASDFPTSHSWPISSYAEGLNAIKSSAKKSEKFEYDSSLPEFRRV